MISLKCQKRMRSVPCAETTPVNYTNNERTVTFIIREPRAFNLQSLQTTEGIKEISR